MSLACARKTRSGSSQKGGRAAFRRPTLLWKKWSDQFPRSISQWKSGTTSSKMKSPSGTTKKTSERVRRYECICTIVDQGRYGKSKPQLRSLSSRQQRRFYVDDERSSRRRDGHCSVIKPPLRHAKRHNRQEPGGSPCRRWLADRAQGRHLGGVSSLW